MVHRESSFSASQTTAEASPKADSGTRGSVRRRSGFVQVSQHVEKTPILSILQTSPGPRKTHDWTCNPSHPSPLVPSVLSPKFVSKMTCHPCISPKQLGAPSLRCSCFCRKGGKPRPPRQTVAERSVLQRSRRTCGCTSGLMQRTSGTPH